MAKQPSKLCHWHNWSAYTQEWKTVLRCTGGLLKMCPTMCYAWPKYISARQYLWHINVCNRIWEKQFCKVSFDKGTTHMLVIIVVNLCWLGLFTSVAMTMSSVELIYIKTLEGIIYNSFKASWRYKSWMTISYSLPMKEGFIQTLRIM